MPAFPAWWRG